MAISAFLPAARVLATQVAANPAVQEFGRNVLKNAADIAVDAAAQRLTRGVGGAFSPPEGLARRAAPPGNVVPRPDNSAGQARRSNATGALAMLMAARSTVADGAAEPAAVQPPGASRP